MLLVGNAPSNLRHYDKLIWPKSGHDTCDVNKTVFECKVTIGYTVPIAYTSYDFERPTTNKFLEFSNAFEN